MALEEIMKSAISRAGIVHVENALNPFLWAFAWSALFAVVAYLFKDDVVIKYISVMLAALPELIALGVGIGFAIKAPDRLQSEKFVLRQRELMIYEKGSSAEAYDPTRETPRVEHLPRGFVDGGET